MINDADDLAVVLRRTVLAGLPVEEVAWGCLRVLGVEPSEVLPAWQAAREVLPATGRRPVFLTNDYDGIEHLLGGCQAPEPPQDRRLAELDGGARSIDPWSAFGAWPDSPVEENQLHYWVPTFEGVDLLSEAREHLISPTRWSVDRWVYERVLYSPGLITQAVGTNEEMAGTGFRYEPSTVELWFLPTASAHLPAAYVDYFPTMGREEILSAALWQWDRTWGAGLVAAWGTILQLKAARRPSPGAEAWELARQLKNFATHMDDPGWRVALQVTRRSEWLLHSRP